MERNYFILLGPGKKDEGDRRIYKSHFKHFIPINWRSLALNGVLLSQTDRNKITLNYKPTGTVSDYRKLKTLAVILKRYALNV